jgi:hypothetical protein
MRPLPWRLHGVAGQLYFYPASYKVDGLPTFVTASRLQTSSGTHPEATNLSFLDNESERYAAHLPPPDAEVKNT